MFGLCEFLFYFIILFIYLYLFYFILFYLKANNTFIFLD